jgi:hypothetical protein
MFMDKVLSAVVQVLGLLEQRSGLCGAGFVASLCQTAPKVELGKKCVFLGLVFDLFSGLSSGLPFQTVGVFVLLILCFCVQRRLLRVGAIGGEGG